MGGYNNSFNLGGLAVLVLGANGLNPSTVWRDAAMLLELNSIESWYFFSRERTIRDFNVALQFDCSGYNKA
jgi:hypothetical protein